MKKIIFLFLILCCIFTLIPHFTANAASTDDQIIFLQTVEGERILYISKPDGSELQTIARNPKITAFFGKNHMLYYTKHILYEYNPLLGQSKPLTKFTEDEISLEFLSGEPNTPDQALIYAKVASNPEGNWYILELSDGSIRRVESPVGKGETDAPDLKSNNADNSAVVVIHQVPFSYRFNVEIQEKSGSGYKTVWSLPKEMTVIPEMPVWSPNSRWVAFYGKKYNDTFEGFYGLYLFDLETKKLQLVQERVFCRFVYNVLAMQDFTPDWSGDSKYLICQIQPFGEPTESSLLKYETATGKKYFLNQSRNDKQYPTWSPSTRYIAYLSDQDSAYQLFVTGADGENPKRVSPAAGYTEWAKWIEIK